MSNNINKITDTALKEHRLEMMMVNLAKMSGEMGRILPEFSREVPDMGHRWLRSSKFEHFDDRVRQADARDQRDCAGSPPYYETSGGSFGRNRGIC